jgi:hypothetical protein
MVFDLYAFEVLKVADLFRPPPSSDVVTDKMFLNEISSFCIDWGASAIWGPTPTLRPPRRHSVPDFVEHNHDEK